MIGLQINRSYVETKNWNIAVRVSPPIVEASSMLSLDLSRPGRVVARRSLRIIFGPPFLGIS